MRLLDITKSLVLTVLIAGAFLVQPRGAQAENLQTLTVAGGCFWCVEADFEKVAGVREVVSGYTGGNVENPTYKEVTRGTTGHFEAVQIHFDADQVSRAALLSSFLRSIDPTDSGGQFCDRGSSYRSAIFVTDEAEKTLAEQVIEREEARLGQRIVTPVLSAGQFYVAEDAHQNYYRSTASTLTRFGYITRADAYKRYREACGRDARVLELWGDAAAFVR